MQIKSKKKLNFKISFYMYKRDKSNKINFQLEPFTIKARLPIKCLYTFFIHKIPGPMAS